MKKNIFFFLLMISFNILNAQSSKEYEFAGTLALSTNELITYKINFKMLNNEQFSGLSLTDIYGDDRTTSSISGNINSKKGFISFAESKNINTKSKYKNDEFCYVEINNAKFITVKNKTIIKGKFIGKFSNGNVCATGMVYLVSTNYLEEMAEKYVNKKYIKNLDTLSLVQNKIKAAQNQVKNTELKSKQELKVNWTSSEVIIDIWDGEREDLDEIEVYINDKKVIDRLILKQKKRSIVIPYPEDGCIIKIVGLDEGTSAPCTANILLRDNADTTPVITVLKKGEYATINLMK